MTSQVFISHCSADRAAADQVRGALESAGIPCWIAPRDIVPGKDWGEAIVNALSECRVMVLVFSASANDSKEVRREVQCAFESDVAVVPLRLEHVAPAKGLQYYLNSVHWLDAVPLREQDLRDLVETVRRHLDLAGGSAASAGNDRIAGAATVIVAPAIAARAASARTSTSSTSALAGPLAYATPFPARTGRRVVWLAVGAVVFILLALGSGAGYARYQAERAAYRAAVVARTLAKAKAATRPPVAAPPLAPLNAQGARAASEILNDLEALNDHLGTFTRTLDAGPGEAEVKTLRDLADSHDPFASYINTLGTTHGWAASNATPVKDRVQAMGALGARAETVRRFADDLFTFRQAERDLPPRLDELIRRGMLVELAGQLGFGEEPDKSPGAGGAAGADHPLDREPSAEAEKERTYARRMLAAESAVLRARAATAHASGLRLLGELGASQPIGTDGRLSALTNLGPAHPRSGEALDALEAQASTRAEQAAADRDAVAREGERLWQQTIDVWSARLMPPFTLSGRPPEQLRALLPADLPDVYRIDPSSPATAAAALAASARRDGWDAAALVAYFAYASRFSASDPAADDYARAAVQCTLQRSRLGLAERQGALYVARVTVAAGEGAGEDGLRPGDVLLTYAAKPAGDAEELSTAMKDAPAGQPVQLEFLRRDAKGLFARRTATLPHGGPVPAIFLPL